ncbi:hypothetical protein MLD38_009896 [Melastoma candidum]|uniref:Uncharacterized protein n=1 Tax=Melastoma candidum TaxID=119954 RepID=A0ACB9S0X8_9MYRT|nr:hypothetical protein MLD38_009896 [Melastoma candidum]
MSRQMTTSHFHKSKTLDNKYMLGDEIGKGAYGRVYKGLDLENGDFVAIKQVSLENIAQEDLNIIMQEIDLLKNLNHKNIVKYLGSLKTKTHLHIILEYVENGSLANIIKPNKFGPFPESLVAVYIAQVLEGLVYLHEQGVIHRDIKGANILTTKEGLVKLADFGVATKLNEADVNTHSVVGTPYWMAPEVIEMSGVCAASDIWSVGCTVIELLTCIPPYYDLQPMPALFRIVQDDHPPIPDNLSPDITDFLRQCFKKDARQRPDAKTLLSHPWIQNCRRALHSSLRHSGTLRNIQEDASIESGSSHVANEDIDKNSGADIVDDFVEKDSGKVEANMDESDKQNMQGGNLVDVKTDDSEEDTLSYQVPTLAIVEKSKLNGGSDGLGAYKEMVASGEPQIGENTDKVDLEVGISDGEKSPYLTNELSKFSDTPGDASLDDLFHPVDRASRNRANEASSSSTYVEHAYQGNAYLADTGTTDLATKLRAKIAQNQLETEIEQQNGGRNIISLMIDALKDDVIDIDGLVFDEKLPGDHLFPSQAVEFGRLVGSLRPEEPEEVIVSACQKLIAIFRQRPDQKLVFVSQHGLLPLMDLLEVPNTRVMCLVLQIINQIIKDNTDFQENACLVGLIPVVMGFAVPDRPREVRMEAAYFVRQLCQSSSLTLQMFIACRGIPVLVGFLEADYAKYREMVHLAIDGMWQVFKLQRSTPRNEFCRIAAKNGILLRLINTLYSLNEATRLATVSGGAGYTIDGLPRRPRSGQLDTNHPAFMQNEMMVPKTEQADLTKVRHGSDHSVPVGIHESSHASNPHAQKLDSLEVDKHQMSNVAGDAPMLLKLAEQSLGSKEPMAALSTIRSEQRMSSVNRISTEKAPKSMENASNGLSNNVTAQQEQVRPLLSLLDKEPPSRHFTGQIDYVRHLSGLERHESILPLLHAANERKTNGELDLLMAEFAEVTGHGRENLNLDSTPRASNKAINKKAGPYGSEGALSASGIASQTTSGVLSGSGILNARPGSAASSGLLSHMTSTLSADVAREYLEKVADLLLEFAQADTTVKSHMCSQGLLIRLFQMFNRIERPILLKLLKCINYLSADPNCLESLQRAEAIKYLIPNLEFKEGALISQIHNEVLHALFNLCKINKRRQEQAAENGIIPHLMHFIVSDSPLKRYALPLLCDMAHASRNSREQLRAHGGLDVYLSLLDNELWSGTALDSIAVCLAHDNDNRKVEQALLKKEAVQKLVKFFQCCPEQHFAHILEPFLKIITKSARINTTLAVNGLTPLLIARLDHQDAIARLNLLKLIKAVYEHHPRPKQLIVENNLPQKLQNLIEERRDGQSSGGQVLVKQMATSLLKALHINTVL